MKTSGAGTTAKNAPSDRLAKNTKKDGSRFQRDSRLSDPASFGRVFKNARRSRDRFFTVLYRDRRGRPSRLGLAIGKKHCRSAVGRNRIKRIVRESFRQHTAALAGLDIVVLNQPDAARASKGALFESLALHWQRCIDGKSGKD